MILLNCSPEICYVTVLKCDEDYIHKGISVRIKILLNQQLHSLFRVVEDHYFPGDTHLPKFVIDLNGKLLVAKSTPKKCWNAVNGVDYVANLVLVSGSVLTPRNDEESSSDGEISSVPYNPNPDTNPNPSVS